MGKAIKGTTVKVDGQSGPLGKGVPISTVLGQGGLYGLFKKKPMQPNMQVTGFKSLINRGIASGKVKTPPGWPKA